MRTGGTSTPKAEPAAARDRAPKPTSKAAKKRRGRKGDPRKDILNRLQLDCDDAETCFFGDEVGVVDSPIPLSEAELDGLLREILAGLEAHQDDKIRRASAELLDERKLEEQWFGSSDHHLSPSTAYYEDPLAALNDRPPLHLEAVRPADFDIPIVLNQRTQNWMVYFLTRGRKHFVRWLARAERYDPLLRARLKEAGLPEDLVYQSMIESGFNPYATSTAAAVGVWQFMPRTGVQYGLHQDWWVDERRDPVRATTAAIRYMSYLYRLFGKWELASAAYNAGEGKIGKAIKMYGTDDFWELSSSDRNYLKPETKNYVPKIMAAAILSKYADRYGLREDILEEDRLALWDHDIVQVAEATDLATAAELLEIELEELQSINPHLRRGFTPPGVENYELNVPRGHGTTFAKKLEELPKEERITFVRHKVARGDSLGMIAGNYGVPMSAVSALNDIRDPRSLRVGQVLTIPVRAENLAMRQMTHVVARGETLGAIAGRYSTSVTALKEQNGLKGDTISVGQRLAVTAQGRDEGVALSAASAKPSPTPEPRSSSSSSSRSISASSYTVQRGDTISGIAAKFGTTWTSLRSANGLSSDGIKVGQRLKIPGAAELAMADTTPKQTRSTYTVRSGDALGLIAERHGMSLTEIQSLNSLRSSNIRVGQSLTVYGSAPAAATAAPARKATTHVVASGEVLGTIAEKYEVSVADLQRWNDISGSNIRVGQKLTLHASGGAVAAAPPPTTHKVESGESLWSIAQKHGVSVADLQRWNDISGSTVKPGQKLTIRR